MISLAENTWNIDRHAEIELIYKNEENDFEVTRTIYVTQEKREEENQLFGVWQKVALGAPQKYYFNSDYTFKLTNTNEQGKEDVLEKGTYEIVSYKEQKNETFNYMEFYGTIKDSGGRTRDFYSAKYANDDRLYLILDNESYYKLN